ncbi:MAG: hypothetical protein FGM52_11125, partial [Mycobacterium sp.]|nr:hypothetical protein [Mycobacterium sp.]
MNVSLRSQLVAGVAALGAAAVAIAPVAQPDLLPSAQRAAAAVELAALANPLTEVGAVIQAGITDVFGQAFVAEDIVWPEDFYGEYLYAPLNFGQLPDWVNQFSSGPLSGLANNVSGYAAAGLAGVVALGDGAAAALFNTPAAVVTAVSQLAAGDPEAALNTLIIEIVAPLQLGIGGAVAGASYVVDNFIGNLGTVVTEFLPFLAQGVFGALGGALTLMGESLGATFTAVVESLGAGDVEAAWNGAVTGLLGLNGTLGQLEAFTLGLGLGRDVDGEYVLDTPSPRSVITSELQRLGGVKTWGDGGITNEPFELPVAEPVAQTAAAVMPIPEITDAAARSAPQPAAAAPEVPAALDVGSESAGGAPEVRSAVPEAAGDAPDALAPADGVQAAVEATAQSGQVAA